MKKKDRIELRSSIIQASIIESICQLMDANKVITQSTIAKEMGKSRSFVSQLFSGNKTLNFNHLAHFERIFGQRIKFEMIDPKSSYQDINIEQLISENRNTNELLAEMINQNYSESSIPKKRTGTFKMVA